MFQAGKKFHLTYNTDSNKGLDYNKFRL
jgi:hypothetical protein